MDALRKMRPLLGAELQGKADGMLERVIDKVISQKHDQEHHYSDLMHLNSSLMQATAASNNS